MTVPVPVPPPGSPAEIPATADSVGEALAVAVGTVPGVSRIEPPLLSSLRRPGQPPQLVPVRLRRQADRTTAAVRVDLVTAPERPAVEVAASVQHRVREVLTEHGLAPGPIEVAVLSVE